MRDIDDIFGPSGPLARALAGYSPRRVQRQMAARVAKAFEARQPLIIEAGTGTGKTFAYLVPALLSGLRVLISTGTRTLQDQLFTKDLPLVAGAIGVPARIAVLKGRSNYLCVHRLEHVGAQQSLAGFTAAPSAGRGSARRATNALGANPRSPNARDLNTRDPGFGEDDALGRVRRWATVTRSGDLAEVPGLSDSHPLWPQITSTRDNCLGQRCADFGRCHVVAARRAAQEADVVIVNHHLLLADLALKEDGFGDLLGTADAVVIDEAHQLPDLATQFFGASVSSRQIEQIVSDTRAECGVAGVSLAEVLPAIRDVEAALAATAGALPRQVGRSGWDACPSDPEALVLGVAAALRALALAIEAVPRDSPLAQCAARATHSADTLDRIALAGAQAGARTVEITARGFALGLLPFDIAERFRGIVEQRRAAWVFTSATLSVGEDFGHFSKRLGLADAETVQIASPFDYESQTLLYLPMHMPDPATPDYVQAVVDAAMPLVSASGGGAFLLFTSHRALSRAAELVRSRPAEAGAWRLLVQGEAPREQLLRDFREHGNAVLLGTASFWEGVDVKGAALRLVIIEKLPFASPDDPLVKARIAHLRSQGGNPFGDYQLPEAALALKQGVGRLIRSEDDRGMIVICDPRLTGKSYGRVFRASLPPMPVTRERAEAVSFLRRLAQSAPARPVIASAGQA